MSARWVAGVLWILVGGGCARTLPVAPAKATFGREQPLDFVLTRFPSGERYALSSDRGQVILLDVWATWCEPCRDALPVYQRLAERLGERGLKVYALNVDEDVRQIPKFLDETGLKLPILHDPNAEVSERALRVRLMPTSFLIDRKGRIRFVHEGFSADFEAIYQAELEQLLAESGD